jgi:hypothetical protein
MQKIRRIALMLLAAAVFLPVCWHATLAFRIYWSYTRRGLPFEGKGAIFGTLIFDSAGAVFWLIALVLYLTSAAKARGPSMSMRILELILFAGSGYLLYVAFKRLLLF